MSDPATAKNTSARADAVKTVPSSAPSLPVAPTKASGRDGPQPALPLKPQPQPQPQLQSRAQPQPQAQAAPPSQSRVNQKQTGQTNVQKQLTGPASDYQANILWKHNILTGGYASSSDIQYFCTHGYYPTRTIDNSIQFNVALGIISPTITPEGHVVSCWRIPLRAGNLTSPTKLIRAIPHDAWIMRLGRHYPLGFDLNRIRVFVQTAMDGSVAGGVEMNARTFSHWLKTHVACDRHLRYNISLVYDNTKYTETQ